MDYNIIDYKLDKTDQKDMGFLYITVGCNKILKNRISNLAKEVLKKSNIKIDGFRPGKVPTSMVIDKYGKIAFFTHITYDIVNYLVKKTGLLIACFEDLREIDYTPNQLLKFRTAVEILPVVELDDRYLNIDLPVIDAEITDEEIDVAIDALKRSKRTTVEKDENAVVEDGDFIVFEYEGLINGEKFNGNKGKTSIIIGKHLWTEDFENQMVGKRPNEEFVINTKFPDDHHDEELKGREVEYKINIDEIKNVCYPEINDAFAKKNGCPTVEDLKNKYRDSIKYKKEYEKENKLYEVVEEFLLKTYGDNIEIPQKYFEGEVALHIDSHRKRLEAKKVKLEDWLERENIKYNDYEDMIKQRLTGAIKVDIIMKNIALKENIQPTDEEVKEVEKTYGAYKSVDTSDVHSFLRRKKSMGLMLAK